MIERVIMFVFLLLLANFLQYILERVGKCISLSSISKVYMYTAIGLIPTAFFCNRLSCMIVPLMLSLLGGHIIIEVINLPTKRIVHQSIAITNVKRKRVIKAHYVFNIVCQLVAGLFIIL